MQFKNDIILYLHTSYPDAGWDIPNLVKNSKFSNRIFSHIIVKSVEKFLRLTTVEFYKDAHHVEPNQQQFLMLVLELIVRFCPR
jgi:hypothetical protein